MGLEGVSRGYRGYRCLQEVTRSYMALERVKGGW